MGICNALISMIFVPNLEKYAQIGVVKMVFAQEEFVIAILDFMVMIVVKLNVLLVSILTNQQMFVFQVALLELIKINILKLAYLVILHANNVEMSQLFVLDVYQHQTTLNISILHPLLVLINALQILSKMEMIVGIVIVG